jgi:acyl carrier protein
MTNAPQVQTVIDAILAVKPGLNAGDVGPDASLTRDLGLDSLDLVELAGHLTAAFPDFELREWLARAMSSEVDSIRSMVPLLTSGATR